MPLARAVDRRALWPTALAALMAVAPVRAPAIAGAVPSFLQAGPYGDAILLAPTPLGPVGHVPPGTGPVSIAGTWPIERGRPFPGPTKIFSLRSVSGAAVSTAADDDDDDEPHPSRPGTLPKGFTKLPDPTPYLRNRSLGPHLVPDAEYPLTDRTTLGLIGQLDRLDGKIGQSVVIPSNSRLAPATGLRAGVSPASRSKDLGLGLSLEYKFGP